MKKTALFVLLAVILTLTACDDFLGSSWGSSRDYDEDNINVNYSNYTEWLARADGNPKLAAALQKKLTTLRENETDPAKKAAYTSAAVSAAIKQSGLGTLILKEGSSFFSKIDSEIKEQDVRDLLVNIQKNFSSGQGKDAADNIANAAKDSIITNGNAPAMNPDYTNSLEPSEAAQAVMILSMTEFTDINPNTPLDSQFNWAEYGLGLNTQSPQKQIVITNPDLANSDNSKNALIAAAYINTISDSKNTKFNNNEITKGIRDSVMGN